MAKMFMYYLSSDILTQRQALSKYKGKAIQKWIRTCGEYDAYNLPKGDSILCVPEESEYVRSDESLKLFTTPDTGRRRFTYFEMKEANEEDYPLIEWMKTAAVGDVFPGGQTCTRVK